MLHPPYCVTRKQWIYLGFLLFYGFSKYNHVGCQTSPNGSDGAMEPPEVLQQRVSVLEEEDDQEIKKELSSEGNDEPVVLSSANKVTKLSKRIQDERHSGEVYDQSHDEVDRPISFTREPILEMLNSSSNRSKKLSRNVTSLQMLNASDHTDYFIVDVTQASVDSSETEGPMLTVDDQQESSVKDNEQSVYDVQYGSEEYSTSWSPTTMLEVSEDPEISISAMDSIEEPSEPSEVTYGGISQTEEVLKHLNKPTSESSASVDNRTEAEDTHEQDIDNVTYESAQSSPSESIQFLNDENTTYSEDLMFVWNSSDVDHSVILYEGSDLLFSLSSEWPTSIFQEWSPTVFLPTPSVQSHAELSSESFVLESSVLSSVDISSHINVFLSLPHSEAESSSKWASLDSLQVVMSRFSAYASSSVDVPERNSTTIPVVSTLLMNATSKLQQQELNDLQKETFDMMMVATRHYEEQVPEMNSTNIPVVSTLIINATSELQHPELNDLRNDTFDLMVVASRHPKEHPEWEQQPVVILQPGGEQAEATKSMLGKENTAEETSVDSPINIPEHGDGQNGSKETKMGTGRDKLLDDDAKEEQGSNFSVTSSFLLPRDNLTRTTETNLSMFNLNVTRSVGILSSPIVMSTMFTMLTSVRLNLTDDDVPVSKYEFSIQNLTFSSPTTIKVPIPIKPTKASDVMDRWTKYNRLPTELPNGEKIDVSATDSIIKPEQSLPTIRVPVAYLSVTMKCSWTYFCLRRLQFQRIFAQELKKAVKIAVGDEQVIFFNVHACKQVGFSRNGSSSSSTETSVNSNGFSSENMAITVPMYVSDEWGIYSKSLTELLGVIIVRNKHDSTQTNGENNNVTLPSVVLGVQLHRKEENMDTGQTNDTDQESDFGIIVAIIISCIAGVCLVLLFILLVILRRTQKFKETRAGRCRPATTDAYSLDSVSSIHSSFRRRKTSSSKRSYLNQAFNDPNAPSRKLNFVGLSNASVAEESLAEEFKIIPMQMAKYDEMPPGVEEKNRYANIIPFPETRVVLTPKTENGSEYINANYVRGYRGEQKHYIACQAPLEDTMTDFWQMVWENQSKAIIMLTTMVEDGVNRCAPYFAESDTLDSHRLYGDFQVTTQNRDIREDYIISTLQIKNLEKNLMRNVMHFMYTSWPSHQVPSDYVTIAKLLVETRPFMKSNAGPLIVHCSPGTGRTGTVLAVDVCMHEFEFTRMVDIPQCVHRLRQDRGGCVQTAEQYIFIYKVLSEYASRIVNHSGRSSVRSVR